MQAPLTNLYCTNIAKYSNFTTVHIGLDLTYVDCMKNWIKGFKHCLQITTQYP